MSTPKLRFINEPLPNCNFRYKSEKVLGLICGQEPNKKSESYPEALLDGFNGTAIVQCSLSTVDKNYAHPVQLIMLKNGEEKLDPHFFEVSPEKGYNIKLKGLYTRKPGEKKQELFEKKIRLLESTKKQKATENEKQQIKAECEEQIKKIVINEVRLRLDAYVKDFIDGSLVKLCESIYSNPIVNENLLNIDQLGMAASSVDGDEQLILLVKKLYKDDIEVEFYKTDNDEPNGKKIWAAKGVITKVHYKYAIVLKTPSYADLNIKKTVKVLIQLKRTSLNECSDSVPFIYKPRKEIYQPKRKRLNHSSSSTSVSSDNSESNDLNTLMEKLNKIPSDSTECQSYFKDLKKSLEEIEKQKVNKDGDTSIGFNLLNPLSIGSNLFNPLSMGSNLFNPSTSWLHGAVSNNIHHGENELNKTLKSEINAIWNNQGQSVLHLACNYNDHKFVKSLIELGCDPNLQDLEINTALHIAVQNNYIDCIKALLNRDFYKTNGFVIDVNLRNNDGLTSLHLAIVNNHLNIVKMLIEFDTETVDAKDIINGNNALHCAVQSNNYGIVNYILSKTNINNINAFNLSKQTPLDLARSYDPDSRISTLLENYTT